jgi:ubiquinone/menaquinone biosynthesis C-methylase UbiE
MNSKSIRLKFLPKGEYRGVNEDDPIRYYYWPIIGGMYRKRVELCLDECTGGQRILEVGFGTGLTFLNLSELYQEVHGIDLTADIEEVSSVFARRGIKVFLKNGNILEMPYEDNYFDTVLLISILEHLYPEWQERAFREIHRILKPGGQVVYGVPVERPLMVFMFKMLGYDIRKAHFSTEIQVADAAARILQKKELIQMRSFLPFLGVVYEVGNLIKN